MWAALLDALGAGRSSTPVVPSDAEEIGRCRQLYVGTGGTLVFRLRNDTADRTLVNVADGSVFDWDFKLIKETGTDCDDMVLVR